jgi:hypothetical protein
VGDTVEGGAYLYPITVDFYTAFGAGVRTTAPTGIRYQTLVKADSLAMTNGKLGAENFGTMILPYSYAQQMMASETFANKLDAGQIVANSVQHVDIPNNGWASASFGAIIKEGYNTYMGSLVNIKDANLKIDFTGISYLKVTYADGAIGYITADWQTAKDGTEFVGGANYSKDANARSIVTVATAAINDAALSQAVKDRLQQYIDAANAVA